MAKEYKGLEIKFGADTKSLNSALREAKNEARGATTELKLLNQGLKFDPTNVSLLAQKQEVLTRKIQATRKELEAYKTLEADASSGKVKLTSEQWTKLQSDIALTTGKLQAYETALAEMQIQQAAASSKIGQAGAKFTELGEKTEGVSQKMSSIGSTLTRTVTLGLAAAGAASVKAATEIDTSLTNVKKTVDGTAKDYQTLKDAAIEFSKTNAVSASQILDVESLGAQLGYTLDIMNNGKSEVQEFGEVVSGLDIATNMDAETAGSELAQFFNIMQLSKEETKNYASAIVDLGNKNATTESSISAMALRIAGAGKQLNMTGADVLDLATAMSSLGIEAEMGGTAISTIMSSIDKSVALSDKNLQTWADTAGMSTEEFSAAWKNNVAETLIGVLKNMQGAVDEGGNMSVMLDELGINSLRQTDVMKRLAGSGDVLSNAISTANTAWAENVALDNEVANRNDSLAAKFEMLKNRVIAVAEQIGRPLADALLEAIDACAPLFSAIESGAQAFSEMSTEQQRAILSFAGLAAALGPVLKVLGNTSSAFTSIGAALTKVSQGIARLNVAPLASVSTTAATASKSMDAAGKSATSMVSKVKGVAGSLINVGTAAAAVGVVIAGAFVSSEIEKFQTRTEQTRKSTDLMKDSMSALTSYTPSLSSAMQDVANSTSTAGTKAQLTAEDMNTMRESVASAYDSMITANTNYANTKGMLDEALAVLTDTSTSYEDAAAAVEIFNSQAGTNLEVVQNAAGGYDILKDGVVQTREQIDQLTASIEAQMLKEMATEQYQEVYKAKAEAIKEQAAAQEALTRAQEKLTELENAGITGEAWQKQAEEVAYAKQKFDECTAAVDSTSQAESFLKQQISIANQAMSDPTGAAAFVANSTSLQTSLQNNGKSLTDFTTSLNNTGASTQYLGTLTQEQLAQMAANYDGTTSSIISQLVTFAGEVTPEAQAAAQNLKNGMSSEDANIINNVSTLTGISTDKLYEMGAQCGIAGSEDMAKFAAGIASKQDETGAAVDLNAQEIEQLRDENFDASSWGSHLGQNFANGIRNAQNFVGSAVNSLADIVKSVLGHSVPKDGPLHNHGKGEVLWGEHLVANLAKGMTNNIGLIKDASAKIAETVDSELNTQKASNFSVNTGSAGTLTVQANSNAQATQTLLNWLDSNLGTIINQSAPQTVIDNDAGALIVDNRLQQLQRKAGMNRGY